MTHVFLREMIKLRAENVFLPLLDVFTHNSNYITVDIGPIFDASNDI